MDADVLAADDEPDIREVVQVSLGEEFQIQTVSDGFRAWDYLETAENSIPDLVILDVMMPKMDGFSVLEHIREHNETSDIPVLMLTSRSREEDVVRALESGADDFLAKPFNKSELVGRVRQTLE
jgi:DNA-binding response OmpR family regulator